MDPRWEQVSRPPKDALKEIRGGRMNGKTDISPMWRIKVMTETYGLCGEGWKYDIKRVWTEPGTDNQAFAFAEIALYTKQKDTWSEPIPGIGGHMLIVKEKNGLHSNDEAYKMAITDALSVAMKQIGVASEIYMGNWDGSKYINQPEPIIDGKQHRHLEAKITELKVDRAKFKEFLKIDHLNKLPASQFETALKLLKAKEKQNAEQK